MRNAVVAVQPKPRRAGHSHPIEGREHGGDDQVIGSRRHLAGALAGDLDAVSVGHHLGGHLVDQVERETERVKPWARGSRSWRARPPWPDRSPTRGSRSSIRVIALLSSMLRGMIAAIRHGCSAAARSVERASSLKASRPDRGRVRRVLRRRARVRVLRPYGPARPAARRARRRAYSICEFTLRKSSAAHLAMAS